MKKLLLGLISTLLLASTSAQAVIYLRQVWLHPNGKIVEMFSDIHATNFFSSFASYKNKKRILSKLDSSKKQQHDIIQYAKLFGDKVHLFIEDINANLVKEDSEYLELLKLDPEYIDTLILLTHLCKANGITHTNIDNRNKLENKIQLKEYLSLINSFDDGPILNSFYQYLKKTNVSNNMNIMDISVIHMIYEYTFYQNLFTKNRLLIVAGGTHIRNYSKILLNMGYRRVDQKTKFHSKVQQISSRPNRPQTSLLARAIQNDINYSLGLLSSYHYRNQLIADQLCAAAFLVTNPLDIAQIIEEERKELSAVPVAVATPAETKEIAAAKMAAPVVVTPAICSRL